MSPFDSILGLHGLTISRVERRGDIYVWAEPKERPACPHCADTALRIKATHQRTVKHTRLGAHLMVLHLRVPKYHCLRCNRYFRHRFPGIRPRYRATESYRLEVFEAHEGGGESETADQDTPHRQRNRRTMVPVVCASSGVGTLGQTLSAGVGH